MLSNVRVSGIQISNVKVRMESFHQIWRGIWSSRLMGKFTIACEDHDSDYWSFSVNVNVELDL